jgi:hypothetical protein
MKDMIYFTPSPSDKSVTGASRQTMMDGIMFSKDMGFEVVGSSTRSSPMYFVRMLSSWRRSKVFLTMYPYVCPPLRSAYRLRSLGARMIAFSRRRSKNSKSLLYVVDLPIDQLSSRALDVGALDEKAEDIERLVMNQFDMVCVFNDQMKNAVVERCHIPDERFVLFEVLDYGSKIVPPEQKGLPDTRKVVSAGSSASRDTVGAWVQQLPSRPNVQWELFGRDGEWTHELGRKDIVPKGFVSQDELARYIGESGHFGIIDANADPRSDKYHNYGSTSKFSAYMAAGVPIFVTDRYAYICELVNKYHVGFQFKTQEEVADIASRMTNAEYQSLRRNALELGKKVREGYFFKTAVAEAMRKLGVQ